MDVGIAGDRVQELKLATELGNCTSPEWAASWAQGGAQSANVSGQAGRYGIYRGGWQALRSP